MEAVVDKDLTAAALALELGADVFLILTKVDAVYEAFGTSAARPIRELTVAQADSLLARGALGVGSMGPKVAAAARFVRGGKARRAIIAHLERGVDAMAGRSGTTIVGGSE